MKIDTADKWFSRYIRIRDTDENGNGRCCTCGKIVKFNKSDAGHFVNRKHKSLRFSELNVHIQCISCNRFDEGNMLEYYRFMEEKYGKEIIDKLLVAKNTTVKFGQLEIKTTAEFYKNKVKELLKLKNFEI